LAVRALGGLRVTDRERRRRIVVEHQTVAERPVEQK
jgi:hypothetical protein